MSALADQWRQWSAKFAALTRRERVIIALAAVFGGGLLIFQLAVEPSLLKARNASRAEAAAHIDLAAQQAQAAALTARNADPDAASRQRLAQAKRNLAEVSARLAGFEAGMVPPAKMRSFLEELLAKNGSIELRGLKTLPVTQVGVPVPSTADAARELPAAGDAAQAAGDGIYQHGIMITLAGNYNDLLNYLAELERMQQRLMWNSITLTVEKYPDNIMVLRVYTLSLDRNWLIV